MLKEELSETQNPNIFHLKKLAMGSFLVPGQAWVCSSLPTLRAGHSNSEVQGNLVQKATTSSTGFPLCREHLEMLSLERTMYPPLQSMKLQGKLRGTWESYCGGFEVIHRGSSLFISCIHGLWLFLVFGQDIKGSRKGLVSPFPVACVSKDHWMMTLDCSLEGQ